MHELKERVVRLLNFGGRRNKMVFKAPMGSGKTVMVSAMMDELLRGEGDNPSVGLLVCKSTDTTVVEWSLKDINKPLGVASYQLQEVVDRTVAELELRKKKQQLEQNHKANEQNN